LQVPDSNFAQICLVGVTSAHTASDIKKGFQCLAGHQGYRHFRSLLVDHLQRWALYHGPQYAERRPVVWEPLKERPTKDKPRSRQRRLQPPSSTNHAVQMPTRSYEIAVSEDQITNSQILSDSILNDVDIQTPPPTPSVHPSPPWIPDRTFGTGPATETLPVNPVSPLHLSPMSDEIKASRRTSVKSENQDQRGAEEVSSTADSSVFTPHLHPGHAVAQHFKTEYPSYTSLTVRQLISMLLKARQNGHDDSTEHYWQFMPDEFTPGRDHLEYMGRRIDGIQFQVFIPRPDASKKNSTTKRNFCIYGCTGGSPGGDLEWLGPWKYTILIYVCLLTAGLLWHIIGQIARTTRSPENRAITRPPFSQSQ